ncbi:hypothetical protein [Streptomyces mexicanus]|uniref:hypothetical protein n=1 Tax=Streptomyces mexicanus TaxID=178566 RepID=UPI0031EB7518
MGENDCAFLRLSGREASALDLGIRTATSKAGAVQVLRDFEVSEENFAEGFPDLAKAVEQFPDQGVPHG